MWVRSSLLPQQHFSRRGYHRRPTGTQSKASFHRSSLRLGGAEDFQNLASNGAGLILAPNCWSMAYDHMDENRRNFGDWWGLRTDHSPTMTVRFLRFCRDRTGRASTQAESGTRELM